jgi:MOSC domain-containing protein YiiM
MRLDERRFRPNALIDTPGRAQVERSWIGRTIQIGREVVLRASDLTERCVMVNLAQAGLPDDARVLRATGDYFGIYADVLVPGRIERGDAVVVR